MVLLIIIILVVIGLIVFVLILAIVGVLLLAVAIVVLTLGMARHFQGRVLFWYHQNVSVNDGAMNGRCKSHSLTNFKEEQGE
jgi:fatty acid desaturase